MDNGRSRWIVTKHKFFEHMTAEAAQREIARLRAENPEESFRIYRIKWPARCGAPQHPWPIDEDSFAVDGSE